LDRNRKKKGVSQAWTKSFTAAAVLLRYIIT